MKQRLKKSTRQLCICVAVQSESMVMRAVTVGDAVGFTWETDCLEK